MNVFKAVFAHYYYSTSTALLSLNYNIIYTINSRNCIIELTKLESAFITRILYKNKGVDIFFLTMYSKAVFNSG